MLENQKVNIKTKLAALWTSLMFCYVYGDYFEFYTPGKMDSLISGNSMLDSPTKLFSASIVLAIPALMIALSVLLKPSISKWLNIILGILYTAMMIFIAVNSFSPWQAFYAFYAILESLITLTIVYYAWKWHKSSEVY
ncbi:DUF6326 family protein [Arcticibacterium luteifluviistationis]|uniref:DoxX family protein n=1 Tax=Arcticibacterium luteifluviistationis TaxID=1784714 RepID=A0A2Z4G8Q1_9BACT|nr:DUF6326 family protein [Arcticibacterium luteifluviistationis]AWV97485.1 hypothetical protein DJ013_04590 [Arcticibacterium luteifluviistationis]